MHQCHKSGENLSYFSRRLRHKYGCTHLCTDVECVSRLLVEINGFEHARKKAFSQIIYSENAINANCHDVKQFNSFP